MSNDTQPEIRFPGFTEAWEQRKVFELGEIITGNTPSTGNKDYYKGQYLFVSPADIQDNRYVSKTNTTLTELGFKTGRFIRKGSTLFVSIGSTIGKVGQADRDLITNQQINSIIPSNDYDDNFVYSILLGKSAKIKQLAATQAVPIINKTEFGKTIINVPSFEEQIKIGTFFKQIDDTIALHQSKLDLLKETKKGFLQKMFPKNGAKVPEIRFPGFTEDWEQRKLSEMAGFSKGNGYSKADLVEKGHPVILYGRLYTKYETVIEKVDTFAELKEKSVISNGGEVIVPASGETPEDISRASVVDVSGVALGGDLNIIKTKSELDPTFLALTISNGSQQKEMTKRAQGKSVVHLHNSDLKEVNLLYPKLDEQVKIGSFFKKLDVAITLHQRKLDLLKETKKGFLQKMFV
ncbi:restriction endonuclease subunit S [Enterococcus faecium]|uniref:restriction endonuclease subunit S n=1 Tax=Enterococcus faecium TaxID=1352 RepID=UPI0025B1A1F3|nr:restriction endonuclease subunit S [Enterococcus faecium]MDN3049196.1 restriction endonuclease subunit S [Enterococcus faecium]MDV4704406.1 restriction endonuclease subunit S [Enterococcus faecium]